MKDVAVSLTTPDAIGPPEPDTAPETGGRTQRADGVLARSQLLMAALRLFSAQGFAKTSVRAIADAAGANVAAIRYYFGDKAGLYRAVFFNHTTCGSITELTAFTHPALPLDAALRSLYHSFLQPLKLGEVFELQMRLQMREMTDPTGLWAEDVQNRIRPHHTALVSFLMRHFGADTPDDDLHRLAFSMVGLAVHLFVGREVMNAVVPGLCDSPEAVDPWADRLALFALGMVQAEAARRGCALVTTLAPVRPANQVAAQAPAEPRSFLP